MNTARRMRKTAGFTLVEIALSLAIIGFALVAIIGVLPFGLNVQRENREETIIVQDANYLLDAIRSGARGLDDLTNYVESITNYVTGYVITGSQRSLQTNVSFGPRTLGYRYNGAWFNNTATPENVITNGERIIGLLSTPRLILNYQKDPADSKRDLPILTGFTSNYVVAYVRSLNGPAVEKAPQTNVITRDLAFRYRMISEVVPSENWNPAWVDFTVPNLTPDEIVTRSNAWQLARNQQANSYDVRLLFRWPVAPNGRIGRERQAFRTMTSGTLELTNHRGMPIWLMQPSKFQTATYNSAP